MPMLECPYCGKMFLRTHPQQRYCCPLHADLHNNRQHVRRKRRPGVKLQCTSMSMWNPADFPEDPFDHVDRCTGLPMKNANYAPLG